jgi:enamine deaminase RidA (YjgF/YER057c/UK114 family)
MLPRAVLLAFLAAACSAPRHSHEPEPVQHLNAAGRTDTLPFSHGVLAGDLYFVAGTLGLDKASGKPPADAEAEVRAMLDDFRAKLELAGLGMDDLVTVQVFCSDLALYDTFNRVYAGYFRGAFPARAFIGSGPLLRGCRFEIQGIAARRGA